jgi:hypothetical protein
MRVTTLTGQPQAERLGQVRDVGAEVAIGHVAGANLAEQPQPLGRALERLREAVAAGPP